MKKAQEARNHNIILGTLCPCCESMLSIGPGIFLCGSMYLIKDGKPKFFPTQHCIELARSLSPYA